MMGASFLGLNERSKVNESESLLVEADSVVDQSILDEDQGPETRFPSPVVDTEFNQAGNNPDLISQHVLHSGSVSIYGRVTTDDGDPIVDALISEEHQFTSTRTDDKGFYQIDIDLPKYKYPVVNFLRSGYKEEKYALSAREIEVSNGTEVDMVLSEDSASISLFGWIGDSQGGAAVSQKIELKSRGMKNLGNYYYTVFSNSYGEFEFEGIRANTDYQLEVYPTANYHRVVVYSLKLGDHSDHINIVVEPKILVNLTARIVDLMQQPVANLELNIQSIRDKQTPLKVSTDSSGFFSLSSFPAGEVKITTEVPDYFKIVGARLSKDEYQSRTFVIDRGPRFISGWISDEFGNPIKGARVTLDGDISGQHIHTYSLRIRTTDQSGVFSFDGVGSLDYMITAYSKGYQKREIELVRDEQIQGIQVELQRLHMKL